jgi:hypothetical protein
MWSADDLQIKQAMRVAALESIDPTATGQALKLVITSRSQQ